MTSVLQTPRTAAFALNLLRLSLVTANSTFSISENDGVTYLLDGEVTITMATEVTITTATEMNGAGDETVTETANVRHAMNLTDVSNATEAVSVSVSPTPAASSPSSSSESTTSLSESSTAGKRYPALSPTKTASTSRLTTGVRPCVRDRSKVDKGPFVRPHPEKQTNGEVQYTGPKTTTITCVAETDNPLAQWMWMLQCRHHTKQVPWPYPQHFGAYAPEAITKENSSCESLLYKTTLIFRLNATKNNCTISCVLGFMNDSTFDIIQEINTLFKIVPYKPQLFISEDLRCLNYMEHIGIFGTFAGLAIALPYWCWYQQVKRQIEDAGELQNLFQGDNSEHFMEINMPARGY